MKTNYGESTFKFNILTDGGGAAAPPSDPAPSPEPEPTPIDVPSINIPENWKESLSEELRSEPSMGVINDIQSLAKSYIHAQKQVGMDRVVVPGKHSTPDDWTSLYRKLGHPESLDQYEVASPEGSAFDDGFITQIKQVAFENNIMPGQLNNLLTWYNEANNKALEDEDQRITHEVDSRLEEFKKELGAEYNTKVNQASAAFKHLFKDDEGLFSWVNESGMGDDPNFIKMFMKISGLLEEDGLVGGGDGTGIDSKGIDDQINSIMGDIKGPYYDQRHPNHAAAVKEVEVLLQKKHPSPA